MKVFKLIEIDLEKERARIRSAKYNKRQRRALHTLCNLFEKGEWQKCLDHIHKAFPENKAGEYPETEHIGIEMGVVLSSLSHESFYTQKQLLKEVKEAPKSA